MLREGYYQELALLKNDKCLVNKAIAGNLLRFESKAEYDRNYREQNKDKILEQKKEYYQQNKDKLGAKVQCECGSSIRKDNIAKHRKYKKHLFWKNSISLSSVESSSEKSNDSEHQMITQDFVSSEEKKEDLNINDLEAN